MNIDHPIIQTQNLQKVYKARGRAGQALGQLATAQAQLRQAEAVVAQAKMGPATEDIAAAEAGLRRAQANFGLIKAGARAETIAAAQAQVDAAQAQLDALDIQLEKFTITSQMPPPMTPPISTRNRTRKISPRNMPPPNIIVIHLTSSHLQKQIQTTTYHSRRLTSPTGPFCLY